MNDKVLQALTRLFAVAHSLRPSLDSYRISVDFFLRPYLANDQRAAYLELFDRYVTEYRTSPVVTDPELLRKTCNSISIGLEARQKYITFLRLCEFLLQVVGVTSKEESEFLVKTGEGFRLDASETSLIVSICSKEIHLEKFPVKNTLLIHGHDGKSSAGMLSMELHDFSGTMPVVNLQRTGIMLVRYDGSDTFSINGQRLDPDKVYVITSGSVLRSNRGVAIYYSELQQRILSIERKTELVYETEDVTYHFNNKQVGLHELSIRCTTGEMVAIMGGSGAGKSTLLNLLNGTYRPSSGKLFINGINIIERPEAAAGLIGNIPQDDLLVEELTVFQNLYYNTKLCFDELDELRLTGKVNEMLKSIGLWEARDLKVGDALNKSISGGQRKRLNIALELIREPYILFVDEPTSGLSSRDAENVMDLLKQLALSGKLVFVVIHQPSSEVFKMFDRLILIDKGGYLVYQGVPVEAVNYFREQNGEKDAQEGMCNSCGNINPEQIFNILEQEQVDEYGNPKPERKVSPQEWYRRWKQKNTAGKTEPRKERISTPPPGKIAGFKKQLKIFFLRDLRSKLSNRQYLLINLLEAPLMAFVLAYLLRYTASGSTYRFYDNDNLPAYLFICVVVALFLGLSVSGEEILRDRKIRKRESFLSLSNTAYYLSKTGLLFLLSAFQMGSFVVIGNWVLGIHGMNLSFFGVLFSTACFSNMLGLNISATMKTAVAVYILIPIMIIPQILLSGVIVKYNKLNSLTGSTDEVSTIGNMMVSRWAYEAMAVHLFRDNEYEHAFFPYDASMSRATYAKDFWVRELRKSVGRCKRSLNGLDIKGQQFDVDQEWELLKNELSGGATVRSLGIPDNAITFDSKPDLGTLERIESILNEVEQKARAEYSRAESAREKLLQKVSSESQASDSLMLVHENRSVTEMMLNATEKDKVSRRENRLIQQFEPVYRKAVVANSFLQQPFFIAEKSLLGSVFDTFTINTAVIWFMTLVLYLLLQFNILNRLFNR